MNLLLNLSVIPVPLVMHVQFLCFVVLLLNLPVIFLVLILLIQLRTQLRVVLYFERVARFLWQQRQAGFGWLQL